ncbi:MAG TPA: tRNA (adenosine(37)-N6)-threonylcarbamoyltransferase complex dimerization subunit type 1 TsaB [Acidobacteriaceae bacterium]|jgi:tRNA threonylcarbamoyladenosine biosynthesis protein TsaB
MFEHPVLGIDTCGAVGTVALADIGKEITTVTCISQAALGGRAASAQLMPAIDRMLREAGLGLEALRTLVVVNGPGSFTGIRVGLSTAKGLAHATGLPIVAISRLFVLASLADTLRDSLALLDAGRNEFYARRAEREWLASYEEIAAAAGDGTPLVIAEQSMARESIAQESAAEEGIAKRLAAWRPVRVGPLDACAAVRAALTRIRSGKWDDLSTLDANYLRRSDAELFARPQSAPAR